MELWGFLAGGWRCSGTRQAITRESELQLRISSNKVAEIRFRVKPVANRSQQMPAAVRGTSGVPFVLCQA